MKLRPLPFIIVFLGATACIGSVQPGPKWRDKEIPSNLQNWEELPSGFSTASSKEDPGEHLPLLREESKENSWASKLSLPSKKAIALYAYALLDSHYVKHRETPPPKIDTPGFTYERLYITCYHGTQIRGSQSGGSPKDAPDRLVRDIKEAVGECVEDRRFGGKITEDEIPETSLVFNLFRNNTRLTQHTLTFLERHVDLGIHALRLKKGNKSAFFKESKAISKNYSHKKLFNRLCKNAKLPKNCFLEEGIEIILYDTVTFRSDRAGHIVDLYRYDVVISEKDLTKQNIRSRLDLAYHWFLNNVNPVTGRGAYKYYPSRDKYSSKQSHVRALASAWSMVELQLFLDKHQLSNTIRKTLTHYLSFQQEKDGVAYLEIEGKAKIAYNAFLILLLTSFSDYPDADTLARKFADGLLRQQDENGSFRTHFFSERNTGTDYYPGEAILAMMRLYKKTGDERYRLSVERAFPYYRAYWRGNKNTAFIPWHTQAYFLLFIKTGDKELADFIFEMNDWLIDNHQIYWSNHPDEIGGFPKGAPRNSTGSYLEGIVDAYALSVNLGDEAHTSKYRESIRNGARFLLQIQITERNAFYLKNPCRAIGGFRKSLTRNNQRNDYTQHAALALIKALENNIFPDS